MKAGERFELECMNHLNKNYKKDNIIFVHHDTADSTGSDIEVFIDGVSKFYIEAKDEAAQSGQFVLLTEDDRFIFSPRNKTEKNEMTDMIIDYMNDHFDKFNTADTAGENIDIDQSIFISWIINHYKHKGVKYILSKKDEMFICPIEKFGDYFEVSAKFRIKKSGSKEPSLKLHSEIITFLKDRYGQDNAYTKTLGSKNKVFVHAPMSEAKKRFEVAENTYFLSPFEDETFEVRQLSKTNNRNVIFSIKAKQDQQPEDLQKFKQELL